MDIEKIKTIGVIVKSRPKAILRKVDNTFLIASEEVEADYMEIVERERNDKNRTGKPS